MSPLVVRPTCLWTLPALLYDDHGKDEATQEIGTACDENRLHCITASEGTSDLMRFHAKYVSASEAGDYCLAFEIARKRNTYVEVSCSLDAVEFKEVQRIVNIIFDQHG